MMLLGLYHDWIDKLLVDFRETEIGQMCIDVDNFTIGKIWITGLCFFRSWFSLREHHVNIISKLLVWTKVWGNLWMSRSYAYSLEVFCNHLISTMHGSLLMNFHFRKKVIGLLEVWVPW
ncbi:hypothetical protein OIU85_020155 [Salix viminalis]|uniref:Uncharacterized protein n=1 Tax=Salix viminalis TaxID=40686 RepID=A0A9Q0UFJ1_SALVM|nr:hypothetical protein OIU85_020155 [Salix viminalis]